MSLTQRVGMYFFFVLIKTVWKAPIVSFFIYIPQMCMDIYNGKSCPKEIKLQKIKPILHTLFEAMLNSMANILNISLEEGKTSENASLLRSLSKMILYL
jgi:hypothetical protein